MSSLYLIKTWPYRFLFDFKGYTVREAVLKLMIWPFAILFFITSMGFLFLTMVMNFILRSWVVYPRAMANVTEGIWQPRGFSLFGWVGRLLSFSLLIFYGFFILSEKLFRRTTLGILRFLDLKES
jgi:hypothetical protein